jgi:hypothetical protein
MEQVTEMPIVVFMQTFLNLQANAYSAYLKQDIRKLNPLVDELNSYGTQHLQDQFGVAYQKKTDNDVASLYENEDMESTPALLFMIKKYNYHQFGKIYRAYVSAINPHKKSFSKCYFIIQNKERLLIVAQYSFIENRKKHQPEWENNGGEDIAINRLGKAIETIKLNAPTDNILHLKEYEI